MAETFRLFPFEQGSTKHVVGTGYSRIDDEGSFWLLEVLVAIAEAVLLYFWCVITHARQYFKFVSMYFRALVHLESLLN